MCAAPFSGAGAPLMRAIGKKRSDRNPSWCTSCFDFLATHGGGADIEATFLFADVRGSTTLAEHMTSAEFRGLMSRFYDAATAVVLEHDGVVDKFVGDELVAMFFPLFAGEGHSAAGVEAARKLLVATGHSGADGPWVPLGAGVHTGAAWVGAVGTGARIEFTALGDAVNTTARLASAAGAGEILVTAGTAEAAGLDSGLERSSLALKGKEEATQVVRLLVQPSA
jgi:adenylate cyclase